MYRGTTPVLPITIKGIDLSEARVFLTIQNGPKDQLTLVAPDDFQLTYDGEDTVGEVPLTQRQTLALTATAHEAQIRWILADGTAGATKKATVFVNNVLLKGVISYE